MSGHLEELWNHVLRLTEQYGYHAVVPVLAADPAGVPWAWIFLLLIAEEARLNVPFMLVYGFFVLSILDHAFYAIGYFGGRPLVDRLGNRWPKISASMRASEAVMRGRGIWAVVFGRYLPFVGRWVGTGAGLANVPYLRFAIFDAMGVGLTVLGFGFAAHFIGREIVEFPWFPQAVMGAYAASTIITILITFYGVWLVKKRRADAAKAHGQI